MAATAVLDRWISVAQSEIVKTTGFSEVASDKPWLDFLKEILMELLPMFLDCLKTPQAAAREANDPGPLRRARLKLYVNRKLGDRELIAAFGEPIYRGILAIGKSATKADFVELADAA